MSNSLGLGVCCFQPTEYFGDGSSEAKLEHPVELTLRVSFAFVSTPTLARLSEMLLHRRRSSSSSKNYR